MKCVCSFTCCEFEWLCINIWILYIPSVSPKQYLYLLVLSCCCGWRCRCCWFAGWELSLLDRGWGCLSQVSRHAVWSRFTALGRGTAISASGGRSWLARVIDRGCWRVAVDRAASMILWCLCDGYRENHLFSTHDVTHNQTRHTYNRSRFVGGVAKSLFK